MAFILDLTSLSSVYGTRLLVEAGHRVVRVEPSAGDNVRRQGPFLRHHSDLEHGTYHHFMNAGKESFTLNPGSVAADEVLASLVHAADAAVVSLPSPYATESLLKHHPNLALVEIDDVGNELCAFAESGLLSLTGHPDRSPVLLGGHVAFSAIGIYVAIATSTCLLGRDWGRPAHVRVSAAQCLAALTEQGALVYHTTSTVQGRRGYRGAAATAISGGFPCADGYWMLSVPSTPDRWPKFVDWVDDPVLKADPQLVDEDHRHQKRDLVLERLAAWSQKRGKHELVDDAQSQHIPSSPISTTDDLAADPQLLSRGFLQTAQHPEFGTMLFPTGAIAQTLGGPPRFAPSLGQHTGAILRELEYSDAEMQALQTSGVT